VVIPKLERAEVGGADLHAQHLLYTSAPTVWTTVRNEPTSGIGSLAAKTHYLLDFNANFGGT
jgi:hypothetical protein